MKSFKNKILQKGSRIEAKKTSTKDINRILREIDLGKINIPQDADRLETAKLIAEQNSINNEILTPNPPSNTDDLIYLYDTN